MKWQLSLVQKIVHNIKGAITKFVTTQESWSFSLTVGCCDFRVGVSHLCAEWAAFQPTWACPRRLKSTDLSFDSKQLANKSLDS